MHRPNWKQYFFAEAILASKMATCDRLSVGAVITRDKRILAKGFNGAPSRASHCSDVNHLMGDGATSCQNAEHAERNAIYFAARNGISLAGSTIYITHEPCFDCLRGIASAGIKTVNFLFYKGCLDEHGELDREKWYRKHEIGIDWGVEGFFPANVYEIQALKDFYERPLF